MTKAVAARDDRPEWGPCMSAVRTDQQRVFVMNFILSGNAAEAARRAGYGTPNTDKSDFAQLGWQLLQLDRVRAAVSEEARRWFHSAAPAAVAEVHRILTDPKARDADKLRAAGLVLDRTDPVQTAHRIEVQHEHVHQHHLSAPEIEKRIAELAAKVGVKALPAPVVIDAEAEEIEE